MAGTEIVYIFPFFPDRDMEIYEYSMFDTANISVVARLDGVAKI